MSRLPGCCAQLRLSSRCLSTKGCAPRRALIAQATLDAWQPGTRVSLFGSRVDDDARGGDIDLLVEAGEPLQADDLVRRRGAFVANLYKLMGERRIDVVVASPGVSAPSDIVESARRRAIELVRI